MVEVSRRTVLLSFCDESRVQQQRASLRLIFLLASLLDQKVPEQGGSIGLLQAPPPAAGGGSTSHSDCKFFSLDFSTLVLIKSSGEGPKADSEQRTPPKRWFGQLVSQPASRSLIGGLFHNSYLLSYLL